MEKNLTMFLNSRFSLLPTDFPPFYDSINSQNPDQSNHSMFQQLTTFFFAVVTMLILSGCSGGKPEGKEAKERSRQDAAILEIMNLTEQLRAEPSHDGEFASLYLRRAELNLEFGSIPRCIKDLDVYLTQRPGSVDGLRIRAQAHLAAREFDEALADIDAVIAANPSSGDAYFTQAKIRKQSDQTEEAILSIGQAIEHSPRNADYYEFRAGLHAALGQSELAHQEIARALEIQPGHLAAMLSSARLHYKEESYSKAIDASADLIKQHPDEADAYILQGQCHVAKKDFDAAIRCADALQSVQPTNSRAHWLRAVCYEQQQNWSKAYRNFAVFAVSRSDSKSIQSALYQYIDLLPFDERFEMDRQAKQELVDAYSQQIKDSPDNPQLRLDRSRLYYAMQRYTESLKDIDAAIKTDGSSMTAKSMRIDVCNRLEKYEEIVDDCRVLLSRWPSQIEFLLASGAAHYQLEQYSDSLASFQRANTIEPSDLGYLVSAKTKMLLGDATASDDLRKAISLGASANDTLRVWTHAEEHGYSDLVRETLTPSPSAIAYLTLGKRKYELASKQRRDRIAFGRGRSSRSRILKSDRDFLIRSAIGDCSSAVKLDYGLFAAVELRSKCHHELEQYDDEAFDLLRLATHRKDPESYVTLAEACLNAHKLSGAVEAYRKAIALLPAGERRSALEAVANKHAKRLAGIREALKPRREPIYDDEYFRRKEAEQRENDRFDRNFRKRYGRF